MEWKVTLAEPDIGQEEINAVTKVLQSKWLTMGAVTREFERKFAEKMEVKYAFAVNNATAALHLANVALGVSAGDEVICPYLTFVASANASRYTGAEVVFADVISEQDLTIDPKDIEAKITPRTKAITVVHYAGFPCLMDEIIEIANKYNLKVIEDCAHSPFAKYKFKDGNQRYVGSIGDIGCFSFFGNKNMTTGEGGMVTTNSDELAEKIRLLRSHGMTTLTFDRDKGHVGMYDVVLLGYNYRFDEIRSAIGLCQLDKVDRLNQKRREIFQFYKEFFTNRHDIVCPFMDRDINLATPHIMSVLVKNNYESLKEVLKNNGIQTSKHYNPINDFLIYSTDNLRKRNIDVDQLLTLPLGSHMTFENIKFITNLLRDL